MCPFWSTSIPTFSASNAVLTAKFQLTVRFMETEVTFVAGLRNVFVSGALREMRSSLWSLGRVHATSRGRPIARACHFAESTVASRTKFLLAEFTTRRDYKFGARFATVRSNVAAGLGRFCRSVSLTTRLDVFLKNVSHRH